MALSIHIIIDALVASVYFFGESTLKRKSSNPFAAMLSASENDERINDVVSSVSAWSSLPYQGCDKAGTSYRTDKGATKAARRGTSLRVLCAACLQWSFEK